MQWHLFEKAKYPAKLLRDWKSQQEKDGTAALSGLRGLTEERPQELITEEIEVRDKKIEDALARFAETDSEAAVLLKNLIEDLNRLHRRPILDEGIVGQLHMAAEKLRHTLGEGTVGELHIAAEEFKRTLDEGLTKLHDAAMMMSRIQGNIM